MYLTYHKKKFPKDILVYIEEYNKEAGYVLFDFYDSNELAGFSSVVGNENYLSKPSMVLIKGYRLRTIRENTYYSINRKTIEFWLDNGALIQNEESALIGYNIQLLNLNTNDQIFQHSVSLNNDYTSTNLVSTKGDVKDLNLTLNGKLKVTVRDVGQGNWNEIINDDKYSIVYDCGTYMNASKSDLRKLIDSRSEDYIKCKPSFFLSHWDKDHYHCLLGMTDEELSSFSNFIFRNDIPNITSRMLLGRIKKLIPSLNLFAIAAEKRIQRGGKTTLVPLNGINNRLVIYNSQYHKNRNISCILLSLKTAKSSVIFSGDSFYSQISQDILPHLNYLHDHNLIVPHHGGNGGNYEYKKPKNVTFKNAIISVGDNSYKHPKSYYVDLLKKDFKVTKTSSTKKDITINL